MHLFQGNLPAPQQVHYNDSVGVVTWSPPINDEIHDASNDFRIIHYNVYVTDTHTGVTHTDSTTDLAYSVDNLTLPCNVSIQVSAVNPSGEGSMSMSITIDCKL